MVSYFFKRLRINTAANRPTLQTGSGDYALSGGADGIYLDGSNE